MGIRLDAGTAYGGAVITPFYDSLLVKVTAHGLRFVDAARRTERSLQEFRVRGVKTNIPFLLNLVTHPEFLAGRFTTRFLDETPELFRFPPRQDRATKVLAYIADVIVNGHPDVKGKLRPVAALPANLTEPPLAPPGIDRHHFLGIEPRGKRADLLGRQRVREGRRQSSIAGHLHMTHRFRRRSPNLGRCIC